MLAPAPPMVITLQSCPAKATEHAAGFKVFCDGGSVAHVGLGFFAGTLEAHQALTLFAAFTAYQVSKAATGELWTRTAGKFLEFTLGMVLAMAAEA